MYRQANPLSRKHNSCDVSITLFLKMNILTLKVQLDILMSLIRKQLRLIPIGIIACAPGSL